MATKALTDAKRLMAELGDADLRQLRAAISARLDAGLSKPSSKKGTIDLVLEEIVTTMKARHGEYSAPPLLKRSQGYPAFREKVEGDLEKYFEEAEANRIERTALIHFAIGLLVENLRRMRLPISARAVMNHIHRLPSVVDRAFPGYAESGLLHLVIRKEERNARQERSRVTDERRKRKPTRK